VSAKEFCEREHNIRYTMLSGECSECGAEVTETAATGLTESQKEALKRGTYVCADCRH